MAPEDVWSAFLTAECSTDLANECYQITHESKCSLQEVQFLQEADDITMMVHPSYVQEQHVTQAL